MSWRTLCVGLVRVTSSRILLSPKLSSQLSFYRGLGDKRRIRGIPIGISVSSILQDSEMHATFSAYSGYLNSPLSAEGWRRPATALSRGRRERNLTLWGKRRPWGLCI